MCLTVTCGFGPWINRTKAEPNPDAPLRVKRFYLGGEHDLSENIIHIVLARLPQAPAKRHFFIYCA